MTLDLTQFHDTFFAESGEALDSMEAALLKLSAGEVDADLINTIFRVAHSIKGGSATFGFSDVAGFTHTLETLLDQLRAGKRRVDVALIDVLLRCCDMMREMLGATQRQQAVEPPRVAALHAELELIMAAPMDAPTAIMQAPKFVASQPTPAGEQRQGWRIHFVPGPKLLRNGNDPLRILRELTRLAPCDIRVNAKWLPPLAELDPEECRLSWRIEMTGVIEEAAVRAAFEWVEGECDLSFESLADDGKASDATVMMPALKISPPKPPVAAATPSSAPEVARATAPATTPEPEPAPASTPASAPASAATILTNPLASLVEPALAPRAPMDAPPVTAAAPAPAAAPTPAPPLEEAAIAKAADHGSIRVSIEKVDELMNAVGELVITQSVLAQLAAPIEGREAHELRNALAQLERHMRELQESVMRVRMLPISVAFNRFPRLIRDLSQRLGKKIELRVTGEKTELDKIVLEKIGDPLVHLIRNAMDHGIETPETRIAAGKPAHGLIHLHASHKGGNVMVEVSDDGGGLRRDRILAKARERGLIGADEELTDERVFNLIFQPGFSTAEAVSDVSGRGVGMDVVKRNINELGGDVQIHSVAGRGSTVRIRLPLTLAILDGQLARVGAEVYVVPIVSIVETIQVKPELVSSLSHRAQVLRLRDDYLPIVRLYELFGIVPEHTELKDGLLMIVEADGKRMGLFVDELMAQQQVVIKSLETNFRPVAGLAGATMLGDGRVALILDVPGVLARFQEGRRDPAQQAA